MRWRTGLLAAAGLTMMLTASGCGHETGGPPAGWEPSAENLEALHMAEEHLVRDCMAAAGHHYTPQPGTGYQRYAATRFRLVLDDAQWANRYGYGAANPARVAAARAEQTSTPTSARTAALLGPAPTGVTARLPDGTQVTTSNLGCLSQARVTLYGDLGRWLWAQQTVSNLPVADETDLRRDPRYTAAVMAWSRCARAHGQPVDSPVELRNTASRTWSTMDARTADQHDKQLASVEARCALQHNVGVLVRTVEVELTYEVRRPYQRAVAELRRLQYAALATL
ncbi:hypothetical protein [Saccharothrix obliqua]|uniref:hypothetical protein n=1 Tax=Saccharothrix obliqua TaxID=2861747 RepID=UPI001C5CE896|nr:hypothetical protein [Saccharothrix obliqua]MBW4717876.1 hypothetical protein [Saccharothrix obliqua]